MGNNKKLRELIKELMTDVVTELSATGGSAGFSGGTGMNYATPKAFSKRKGQNRATKLLTKLGYKKVERPKRPSNTKLVDYLEENI